MGAPRTPFFNKKVDLINKKVDLSCPGGGGGASTPLAPPLATGLNRYLCQISLQSEALRMIY